MNIEKILNKRSNAVVTDGGGRSPRETDIESIG